MKYILATCLLAKHAIGVTVCPAEEIDANWYADLAYCGLTASAASTASSLQDCVNGLTGVDTIPTKSDTLITHIPPSPGLVDACGTCGLKFAQAVYPLTTMFRMWCSPIVSNIVNHDFCESYLSDAIVEFNACAKNGVDLVTLETSTRCSITEFRNFALQFSTLEAAFKCAYEDTSLVSVAQISACIGPDFVAAKAQLGCKSCLDTMISTIQANAASCDDNGTFNFYDCYMDSALVGFQTCAGGMRFYAAIELHCSTDQIRVIQDMRPYGTAVSCGLEFSWNYDCLNYYNSIMDALNDVEGTPQGGICAGHVSTFLTALFIAQIAYECDPNNPFAAVCSYRMSMYTDALYDFEYYSGTVIDTTPTKCSLAQWNAIPAAGKSSIPIIRCAMHASSLIDALDCLDSDDLLAQGLANIPCVSCFRQLAVEAYLARDVSADFLCADEYSSGCIIAMTKPLQIFKECSGFNAAIISNGECSASVQAQLEADNAGIAKVISLVSTAHTLTEALYEFDQIVKSTSSTEYPCMYCHVDLLKDFYTLSAADKATCVADYTNWACYMAMGPKLDKYWRCSRGWTTHQVVPTRDSFSA